MSLELESPTQTHALWLCDLTYTQQSVASDVVPAAIAGLAEYVSDLIEDIRLFKFPEDLLKAIASEQPTYIGFSNYVWNSKLSLTIAERIKIRTPRVKIIFGGPNNPSEVDEMAAFLAAHPYVDYLVPKEGEQGLRNLLLRETRLNTDGENGTDKAPMPGVAFRDESGDLIFGGLARTTELAEIPSPYLSGRLDEFLTGTLMPVVQTNRGCPFTCTFCTEGQNFWTKIQRKGPQRTVDELEYIASKLAKIPDSRRDLLIADSNFGMYPEDRDVAEAIAGLQEAYGWPTFINVATGKNKKERVLEVARIVGGRMNLAGSVQSLDEEVLSNIRRSNISAEALLELAMEGASIGTNTYSEIILGLPGETKASHFNSLKQLVDAGFTFIAMYQLMLLPSTELSSPETRDRFNLAGAYRLLPRCYGSYSDSAGDFSIAEIEEIVVSTSTLSFQDYLDCRTLHYFINVFYNEGVFFEVSRLIQELGGSTFDWLLHVLQLSQGSTFRDVAEDFRRDTERELCNDRSEIETLSRDSKYVEDAIAGNVGANLIYLHKGRSLTTHWRATCAIASEALRDYLSTLDTVSEIEQRLGAAVIDYRYHQLAGVLSEPSIEPVSIRSNVDQPRLVRDLMQGEFQLGSPENYLKDSESEIEIRLSESQVSEMNSYRRIFGSSDVGLSRTLSRVFLRQFLRQPESEAGRSTEFPEHTLTGQFGLRED